MGGTGWWAGPGAGGRDRASPPPHLPTSPSPSATQASPCGLSSPAWPSSRPAGHSPSPAPRGSAAPPAGWPGRRTPPPRARPWSRGCAAPPSGPSCCCSPCAGSGCWRPGTPWRVGGEAGGGGLRPTDMGFFRADADSDFFCWYLLPQFTS